MLKYIQGKIRKWQNKRRFNEYGYEIRQFDIPEFGQVEYAQWLHPLEGTKQIQLSNIQFYQKLVPAGGLILDIGAHTRRHHRTHGIGNREKRDCSCI
jgi:hypothetical protein